MQKKMEDRVYEVWDETDTYLGHIWLRNHAVVHTAPTLEFLRWLDAETAAREIITRKWKTANRLEL